MTSTPSRSRQPSCVALPRQGNLPPDDQMIDSADLVSRLEAAEGGSRELDCDIHEMFRPDLTKAMRGSYYGEATGEYYIPDGGGQIRTACPRYTTSLDAILALVERELPGWPVVMCSGDQPWAQIYRDAEDEDSNLDAVMAATLPLAVCVAFLRARSASQPRAPEDDRDRALDTPNPTPQPLNQGAGES